MTNHIVEHAHALIQAHLEAGNEAAAEAIFAEFSEWIYISNPEVMNVPFGNMTV